MACNTSCPLGNDRSLYDDRIYDEHENHIRCYEKDPVPVVEGFELSTDRKKMLKWIIIILLILAIAGGAYYYCCVRKQIITTDFVQRGGVLSSPSMTF